MIISGGEGSARQTFLLQFPGVRGARVGGRVGLLRFIVRLEYKAFPMVSEAPPCVRGLGTQGSKAFTRTMRVIALGRKALFYNVFGGFRIKCHGVRVKDFGARSITAGGRARLWNTKVFQWFRRRPLACAGSARPRPGHLPHAAVGGFLQKCFVLQRFMRFPD